MPRLMIDRRISTPPGYPERNCLLVSYRLPLLRHCFVLCQDEPAIQAGLPASALMCFFMEEAERLALEHLGNGQAFMLVHSGAAIRKRPGWHLHVFLVQHRWQKAWVYFVLACKNVGLALYQLISGDSVTTSPSRVFP